MDTTSRCDGSRRRMLQGGLCTTLGLAAGPAFCASPASALITRPIPSSGERIPVIGLGTIWFRNAQYDALYAVLQRMYALGGTLIDTAAAYGESEQVIGRALARLGIRNRMFIATKFDSGGGPPRGPGPGVAGPAPRGGLPGPPPGVIRPAPDGVGGEASFERSLARLQTDHVDLLQVHGMNGTDSLMPLMQRLKRAGKIRYIGVTTSNLQQHAELIAVMHQYPLDFIQVDYSLDNRSAADNVLPVAQRRGIAVLANLPLGRATLFQRVNGRPLPAWALAAGIGSWSRFFLQYVVSHPAVTCAIPGATHVNHLEEDQLAARGALPDMATRRRMEAYWDTLVHSA